MIKKKRDEENGRVRRVRRKTISRVVEVEEDQDGGDREKREE